MKKRCPRKTFQPALELLEDRLTPANTNPVVTLAAGVAYVGSSTATASPTPSATPTTGTAIKAGLGNEGDFGSATLPSLATGFENFVEFKVTYTPKATDAANPFVVGLRTVDGTAKQGTDYA